MGIAQINEAVADMDRTTQRNAALVEKTATAASSLTEQAKCLSAAVSAFDRSGAEAQELIARARASAATDDAWTRQEDDWGPFR